LSGLSLEEIKSRIYEPHPLKRNDHDFRLWIGLNDERYSFNTSLGNGIVGWHLQDFTVINKEFNGDYDIQKVLKLRKAIQKIKKFQLK
jgi:cysteinyl-tRNA synthetase